MKTHGETGTRLYRIWHGMTVRCRNKNAPDYRRYGARGVKIEWPDYVSFRNDMRRSYLSHVKRHGEYNTTIDRINSSGNYSKENCRWQTIREQGQNRVNNRHYTYKGKTKTIAMWAEQFGMSRQALRYRLNGGLTIEEALEMPINHGNKYSKYVC